jgi:hypothetical protein
MSSTTGPAFPPDGARGPGARSGGGALLLADRATRPAAIAAGLWAIVGGTIMLVDALALRRMGRVFGQAQG